MSEQRAPEPSADNADNTRQARMAAIPAEHSVHTNMSVTGALRPWGFRIEYELALSMVHDSCRSSSLSLTLSLKACWFSFPFCLNVYGLCLLLPATCRAASNCDALILSRKHHISSRISSSTAAKRVTVLIL